MLPDLHELDAFAAVARHRSFRKAAAERGVSASALSHALRGLEQRLGVRLLHRTTRSVTPTEAGQRLLARLDPALREVADALADATALQAEPAGTVRLNVPRPAARLLLASALAGFAAAYPRVQLEIVTDDGLADIVGDGFDAGIRFGESLAGDMVAVPIGPPQRFVCVAAPDYLAARDGAGIAYVYEAMVREDLAAGRLQAVLEDWGAPAGRFFLYYPGRRHVPMALRALADFIRK
ncbi:LysR family transcriptional regulator [Herbaspirillum sp. SJZ099]|uniref:LysR family transcriptional regulator n=1 Tax=Herbaspirillum sp. SJZ099 TaxID=2572916 RepID=UPI0011AD20BC|nr:LysR family transcriptional regulator [Herbaspirillum sp. SJZ099]TWC69830.1 DNA-binding transcriptional LysR family regulator [Herbaspirillum sp. SJZ099]